MKFFKFTLVTVFAFLSLNVYAALLSGGSAEKTAVTGDELRVTVWNIYKGESDEAKQELEALKNESDLLLLQEVYLSNVIESRWGLDTVFEWIFASAWRRTGGPTGTAIIGRVAPVYEESLISQDTEPFANTPKSSVLAEYAIEGSDQTLLVVSTHALNFTFIGPFERQLYQIAEKVKNHQGPLIWAGDFNTWNWGRWNKLYEVTGELGLAPVQVLKQERFLVLDHIFVRGFEFEHLELLKDWKTSDHWPMKVNLRFE